jgi:hypothetical protein
MMIGDISLDGPSLSDEELKQAVGGLECDKMTKKKSLPILESKDSKEGCSDEPPVCRADDLDAPIL